jgi:hypothetical protein
MNRFTAFCVVALVSLGAEDAFGQADSLVERSQFVFKGTVLRVGAATIPEIRPDARIIVVKVEEVLKAPPVKANYTGREITVRLADSAALQPGGQFVFFTTSWMFGGGIAVREIGRQPDSASLRKEIAEAVAKAPDTFVQRRLVGADLVVTGRVSAARMAPAKVRGGPPGEHDPDWWEAEIQVQTVEKGQYAQSTIVILFPNSRDIFWERSPKFRDGQEGIWILRRESAPARPTFGYHMALEPQDFQPKDQLARVQRLVK